VTSTAGARAHERAVRAATLLAVDPVGLGGIAVRSAAGPARDAWLASLRELLPSSSPVRRVPLHVTDGRLLGGIDLPATLRAGRPVAERGLLAEANGGLLVLAMAERIAATAAARICAVLDSGEIVLERDGLAARVPSRFGVVALDEGLEADERPPAALLERLAFHVELPPAASAGEWARSERDVDAWPSLAAVDAARERLPRVRVDDETIEALCGVARTLGIESLRVASYALRAARAAAALEGRDAVAAEDATLAGQLVFGPRARRLPEAPEDEPPPPPTPEPPPESSSDDAERDATPPKDLPPLEDLVLAAAQAAMPAGLLDALKLEALRGRSKTSGASGALQKSGLRGRPGATRRGEPRGGARLNVVETLRAAAPWQRLRRAGGARDATTGPVGRRVLVRVEDFHVTRHQARAETTTVFVVDASGSSALHRLAEAKGAVELLLADCYVRRDRVAVVAFRGTKAELLLPPTRSLVRAKRSLAGLPGGGGTPLACGLETAAGLVEAVQRRGGTPTIVLLTDGRANVARDGAPNRARAEADAMAAARRLRSSRVAALLVDTAPRPQPFAREIANALGGHYLPLPYADASMLQRAVQAASGA
jgi:magnesium chelatase subunit D